MLCLWVECRDLRGGAYGVVEEEDSFTLHLLSLVGYDV